MTEISCAILQSDNIATLVLDTINCRRSKSNPHLRFQIKKEPNKGIRRIANRIVYQKSQFTIQSIPEVVWIVVVFKVVVGSWVVVVGSGVETFKY